MPLKRKAEDSRDEDYERPNKVMKTGEGEDISEDLAALEAAAEKAKAQAAEAKKKAAKARREQKKKNRAAGIEPKRTRRKKDQAEPDYSELAIKKAMEAKNKDSAKGTRAANSCNRCAARKAKCSDGPGACTACVLDNYPCTMIDKTSLEVYERGELTRLRNDIERLRAERDAYRRAHGIPEHPSPIPENRALGNPQIRSASNSLGQRTPVGRRAGSGGRSTPGSIRSNDLSSQNTQVLAPSHNVQPGAPQYQQSQQLGQYPYGTQNLQNPYQQFAPEHIYQQSGPFPAEQQPYQQQLPPQRQPLGTQRQPLGTLRQPFLGNFAAPAGPVSAPTPAPGTIAPRATQVCDGAGMYGNGGEGDAPYDLIEEGDVSAHLVGNSQPPHFETPEDARLATLLTDANAENKAPPSNFIDPQLLDKELGHES